MRPTWVLSAPDGPHVGPMNLAIRVWLCLCHCLHLPYRTPRYRHHWSPPHTAYHLSPSLTWQRRSRSPRPDSTNDTGPTLQGQDKRSRLGISLSFVCNSNRLGTILKNSHNSPKLGWSRPNAATMLGVQRLLPVAEIHSKGREEHPHFTVNIMGLLPDMQNCMLRMRRNAGNVFPATDFKGNR